MEYEEKIRDRKVGFNHLVPNIPSFLLSYEFKGLGIVTPSKKPIHSHADRQEETRCCFPKETKKYTTPRQQTRETNGWHRTSFCGAPKVEASKRGKIDRVFESWVLGTDDKMKRVSRIISSVRIFDT